ncbi:MAG: hypothetical protein WC682_02720 [Parcubacteria group bacterium]|jgi:hypothetical protein
MPNAEKEKKVNTTPMERLIEAGDYPVDVGYISLDTRRIFSQYIASIRVEERTISTFEEE